MLCSKRLAIFTIGLKITKAQLNFISQHPPTMKMLLICSQRHVKISPVAGTIKLHAVLLDSPNKICVRNTSCFDNSTKKLFPSWCLISLNSKTSDSPQKLSNSDGIFPQLNDYVAAVYTNDKKFYIGQVINVDQTDVNVNFLEHKGEIFRKSIFAEP